MSPASEDADRPEERWVYITYPLDPSDTLPDDTQLSWEAWCAKVEAVLAECRAKGTA